MGELEILLDQMKKPSDERRISIDVGRLVKQLCGEIGIECSEISSNDDIFYSFISNYSNDYITIYYMPWIMRNLYYTIKKKNIEGYDDAELDAIGIIEYISKIKYAVEKRENYNIVLNMKKLGEFENDLITPTIANLSILFTAQYTSKYFDTIKQILIEHVKHRVEELKALKIMFREQKKYREKIMACEKLLLNAIEFTKNNTDLPPENYFNGIKTDMMEFIKKVTKRNPKMEIKEKHVEVLLPLNNKLRIRVVAIILRPVTDKIHYI